MADRPRRGRSRPDEPRNPAWLVVLFSLFVALPAVVAPYGDRDGYAPDLHMSAWLQVLGCLVAVVFCLQRARERERVLLFDSIFIALAALASWALLSLTWAHNRYEGSVKLLVWLTALLGGLLVVQIVRTPRALRVFAGAVFWAGAALALLAIAQHLFRVPWVSQNVPPAATFVNKNAAAQYFVLVFPLGAFLFLRARGRWTHWLCAFGAAAVVIALIYTRTRGAWLGFGAAAVVLCWFLVREARRSRNPFRDPGKRVSAAAMAALALGAAHLNARGLNWFAGDVAELAARTVQQFRFDGGGMHRIAIWMNTLAMIAERPILGVGLGNWTVEYPAWHGKVLVDREMGFRLHHLNAHNDYLEIVAELGAIGGLLVAATAVLLTRKFVRHARRDDPGEAGTAAACLFAALVGVAVHACFSFPLHQPPTVFLAVTFACLLSSLCDRRAPRARAAPGAFPVQMKKLAWYGSAGVFLAGFLVLTAVNARLHRAEASFRRAGIEQGRGAWASVSETAARGLRANPHDRRLLRFVARSHARLGQHEDALRFWERILEDYPYALNDLAGAAESHSGAGDERESLRTLLFLQSIRGHDHKIPANIAAALFRMDRVDEARAYLDQAIDLAPEDERKQNLLAIREATSR